METTATNQTKNTKKIFSNSYRNRKQPTEAQKEVLNSKREELKKLSKKLKAKKSKGEIATINEGLIAQYAKKGHTDLKTINEWNEAGFKVNKGEKALLLWGSKKTSVPREGEITADPYDFHPICFVFSSKQVTARAAK